MPSDFRVALKTEPYEPLPSSCTTVKSFNDDVPEFAGRFVGLCRDMLAVTRALSVGHSKAQLS